jgi:thiaminase/transcriptional activator TenA
MKSSDLVTQHGAAWRQATRHPFLAAVREGTLPAAAFDAWLAQDYHFVGALLSFQARLLARAPRTAQAVLAGGLVALEAELTWFETQARTRGLRLMVALHPVTVAYNEFLGEMDGQPYAPAIVALWAMERAYLDSWTWASPGAAAFRPFVEHWTVPDFTTYVDRLATATDAALATESDTTAVDEAFAQVADLERRFWDMAWSVR